MAKVTLNWKAPSEKKMAEYVGTLGDDKKKEFAKACVEKKDGKNVIWVMMEHILFILI